MAQSYFEITTIKVTISGIVQGRITNPIITHLYTIRPNENINAIDITAILIVNHPTANVNI